LIALSTGYIFSTYLKIRLKEKKTVTIETGIQNSGLALVLLFNPNIFPTDLAIGGMAFIAAWWGIWHILSGLTIAAFWSRVKS
jgi:BASS family bile acid:Na+ symporter